MNAVPSCCRRMLLGAAMAGVALAVTPAGCGRPLIKLNAPAGQVTYAPLRIELELDAGGVLASLQVLVNGHDISDAFAFGPPANGYVPATATDVWSGVVLPGRNEIRVQYELPNGQAALASEFEAVGDPYADAVVGYTIGASGGFPGTQFLPGIVTGPPEGSGLFQGSLDVFSLGFGGSLTLSFTDNIVVDRPGPDLAVFENAFLAFNGATLQIERPFADPARVAVSQDGVTWHEFPCSLVAQPATGVFYPGCAGVYPVLSNANDPATPHASIATAGAIGDLIGLPLVPPPAPGGSGGDRFDLAQLGLGWARYVRIVDANFATGDPYGPNNAGADVDAVAALHAAPATDANANGVPDAVE